MNNWFKNKIVIILLHIAGWLLFFIIPYLLRPEIQTNQRVLRFAYFNWENILQYIVYAIVFYGNAYWLIPRLLNRKKTVLYVLSLLTICVVSVLLFILKEKTFGPGPRLIIRMDGAPPPMPGSGAGPLVFRTHRVGGFMFFPALFPLLFILALSTAYRFFFDKIRLDSVRRQLETEHLKSELSFLRSQISPHFIFNILNSAVALARTNSPQVEATLIQLSGLMRYMLYDAEHSKVPLNQEIEYLESYIDLQKLRFGDRVPIEFSKTGELFGNAIEPMLLIPFVENAFKHGIGDIENPKILIRIIENNGTLYFTVKNKYNTVQVILKAEKSGIGLANVKKRLSLLYPENHYLSFMQTAEWYEVKLKLHLT